MNTSPVQSEMNAQQAAAAAALTQFNYEWIWANGKGGGFWVKGVGYKSLEDCAALINQAIEDFEAVETNRIAEADRAVYEEMQQFRDKPQYLKTLQSTRQSIGNEGIALNDLMQSARFILPALPAAAPDRRELNRLKLEYADLRKRAGEAGDRRDWDGSGELWEKAELMAEQIKTLEAAQPRQLADLKREIADLEQERQTTTDGAKIARIDQRLSDLYREQTGSRPQPSQQTAEVIALRQQVKSLNDLIQAIHGKIASLGAWCKDTDQYGVGNKIDDLGDEILHDLEAVNKQ